MLSMRLGRVANIMHGAAQIASPCEWPDAPCRKSNQPYLFGKQGVIAVLLNRAGKFRDIPRRGFCAICLSDGTL